jgi:hypothetical protein
MSDKQTSEDRWSRLRFEIISWCGSIILGIAVVILLAVWLKGFSKVWEPGLIKEHFAAVVGLPVAALAASCVILAFRQSEGPIQFEFLTLKLKGAAGPVVLWTVCFFVIAGAIKLLWGSN